MSRFRLAFVGLPLAALLLHEDGHEITFAGICRSRAPGTRRLTRIVGERRVGILPDLTDPRTQEAIAREQPSLLVSWFWVRNIPRSLRERFPMGAIGVHPSLLPRHRGPDPFFWAIERGDLVTGVTAHRLDDAYDTGPILGRRELRVDGAWNAWTLAKRLDRPSLSLLRETVKAFAVGAPPREDPQDEAAATLAPEVEEGLLELDWSRPTEEILRRIRAAGPWPGAYTYLGDELVTVTRARRAHAFPAALVAGEAVVQRGVAAPEVLVRTGDGAVVLEEGRSEEDAPLHAAALAETMEKAKRLR